MTQAETLVKEVRAQRVIADKGYDSDPLRHMIRSQGGRPVIPSRQGHRYRRHDRKRYKLRNVVERFIGRLKHFRRVATRYDKHHTNFFGFVCLASLLTIL